MNTHPITTTRLANGVRVVSQAVPGARTVALGVWLLNGGRHQAPGQAGYAHLIEHLWFKRAPGYDGAALARRFEAMGGRINAYTGREVSALHGLVPAAHASELVHLFASMLRDPRFDARDLEAERRVVLQEMALVEEDPGEAIEEWAIAQAWPRHAMGWPILGRTQDVRRMAVEDLRRYAFSILSGGRVCVVATGAMEHAALLRAVAELTALSEGGLPPQRPPVFRSFRATERQGVAQSHLLWLMPAKPVNHADHTVQVLANHLLGGGVSSRLFQELRERRGLVYTVVSHLELYSDSGLWLVKTVCAPPRAAACRAAVEACVGELIRHGPDADELEVSRQHLGAELLLREDDAEGRLERLAREAIYLGRHPELEERLAQLARVSSEDVARLLRDAWGEYAYVEWSP